MEEIKLNLENLSKEEREQLMKLIEKANKPKAGRWTPGERDYYHYWNIGLDGKLQLLYTVKYEQSEKEDALCSIGNIFRTEEEAKFAIEKRKVEVELQDTADELNDGWVPDWANDEQEKYYIYYDYKRKCFRFSENEIFKNPLVYFRSDTIAREAIKKIGEERLKKYYFEVEGSQQYEN